MSCHKTTAKNSISPRPCRVRVSAAGHWQPWLLAWVLALLLPASLRAQNVKPPAATTDGDLPASIVNRRLPGWIRLGGEFRARVEGRTAFGFSEGINDAYTLTRFRLNLDLQPKPWFHAFLQGQDSRVIAIDTARANSSVKDVFDLRQAFVELKTGKKGWLAARVGRQEIILGAQRLVGGADWGNTARSFDAVRLLLGREGAQLSIFAASVVNIDPAHFDKRQDGQNLHGIYGSFARLVPRATLEPYVLWKTVPRVKAETGQVGDADIFTAGLRWVGQIPKGFDYALEMARQAGHFSSDHVAAWAGYGIAGYTPAKVPLKPRFSIEYAYATGDASRGDGRVGTFDQLYPTNHAYYGIVDQVGWRNIRNLRTGVEIKPSKTLKLNFDHHFFWLASGRDGLYNAGGVLTVPAPAGGAQHKDVGREIDVFLAYTPRPQITMGAGFGHLFPGRFLQESSPGSGTSFPYVFMTYRF